MNGGLEGVGWFWIGDRVGGARLGSGMSAMIQGRQWFKIHHRINAGSMIN